MGVLLAWLTSRLYRLGGREGPSWRRIYPLACAALFVHILGDLITQFGTMILAPFSDRRFGLGTTFIIDLVLSGLLVAGLVASALFRRSRVPAALGLLAVVAWVGVGAVGRSEAIEAARAHALEQGIEAVLVDAAPRPASPFNWTAIVFDGQRYHHAHINTRRQMPLEADESDNFIRRFSAPYLPVAMARWEVSESSVRGANATSPAKCGRRMHSPSIAGSRCFRSWITSRPGAMAAQRSIAQVFATCASRCRAAAGYLSCMACVAARATAPGASTPGDGCTALDLDAVSPAASGLRRRSRSERLPVAELDEIAVGVAQPAVVTDRVGFIARRPHQHATLRRLLGHRVDRLAALEGKAQVRKIGVALVAPGPARKTTRMKSRSWPGAASQTMRLSWALRSWTMVMPA